MKSQLVPCLIAQAALAQHSSSNAAYLAAADVWRRRDDEVRAAELELEAAAEAVETQRAKRQEKTLFLL